MFGLDLVHEISSFEISFASKGWKNVRQRMKGGGWRISVRCTKHNTISTAVLAQKSRDVLMCMNDLHDDQV